MTTCSVSMVLMDASHFGHLPLFIVMCVLVGVGYVWLKGKRAQSSNDPKLSYRGGRHGCCAGEGGEGKAEEQQP